MHATDTKYHRHMETHTHTLTTAAQSNKLHKNIETNTVTGTHALTQAHTKIYLFQYFTILALQTVGDLSREKAYIQTQKCYYVSRM